MKTDGAESPEQQEVELQTIQLNDETDLIQLGERTKTYFNQIMNTKELKGHDFDKTEMPSFHKYATNEIYYSLRLTLHQDLRTINRKTDSLLDWLGDWGGLLDSFSFLAKIIMNAYSIYSIKTHLAQLFNIYKPASAPAPPRHSARCCMS